MSEFEEKILEKLSNIEKQQSNIIEILGKTIDIATGADNLNEDFFKSLMNGN